MQIASTTPATLPISVTPNLEAKEGPGPDRDGDADDSSAVARTSAVAQSTPAGMGMSVNTAA